MVRPVEQKGSRVRKLSIQELVSMKRALTALYCEYGGSINVEKGFYPVLPIFTNGSSPTST